MKLFAIAAALTLVAGQASPPVSADYGVTAHTFDISQVVLDDSRFQQNQNRTLNYLKSVDLNRLLYNFRSNHRLSTQGASRNGGWDAPDFPFRTHMQGHFLSAWSQCWASLKDAECRNRATSFVAELQKCQNNNGAAGFAAGYLSGFPESNFNDLEAGRSSTVVYYALHKTMAGLLDVWRNIGDQNAKNVLLSMASWVDNRTARLSYQQMQTILGVEYGGMQDVLAEIYRQTGDAKWITVARRFDQESTNSWLASNNDRLNGNHANTNIPKWVGAAREYKATGTQRYQDIARNAWNMVVNAHTYAIGGNSQNEHFRPPNEISNYLTKDTAEHCNTYNMLKLTKELWTMSPSTSYMDFYERAVTNHILGAQDPGSSHGHGVGPVWGGGTWSTDYDSFWCCQGSGVEQNTRLMDAIYGYDDTSLFVNLYVPSTLSWSQKNVRVRQSGQVPVTDTVTLTVSGAATFDLRLRIPTWTSNAEIAVNGVRQSVAAAPGSYARISRAWAAGDTVTVRLPLGFYLIPANDNRNIAAIGYGPVVLIGNYGSSGVSAAPTMQLGTLRRTSTTSLAFTGTANGQSISLVPWYDGGASFNYVTYWAYSGTIPPGNGCTAKRYEQCGGSGFTGCKVCESGSTCQFSNEWYSQCL
ncbi:secreted protein [Stachybotrys elegans]|uniref:Secreted protein n=1 Tax=Stachybotrys elegans TaxID=80388 RepID=A0A8K0WKK4_9HYPO|nr:secreted protein [Stachybotrys elegans]